MKKNYRVFKAAAKFLDIENFYSCTVDQSTAKFQGHFRSGVVKKALAHKFTNEIDTNGFLSLSRYVSGVKIEITLT